MSRKRRKPKTETSTTKINLTKLVNEKTFSPIDISNVKKIADASIKILAEIGMPDCLLYTSPSPRDPM